MKGKGNDGKGDTVERDEWETPKELFNKLTEQYNFSFDCCAIRENKKTEYYSAGFLNINSHYSFMEMSWMNPPFSKAYDMFKHFFKIIKRGVAIYRCDNMETKIWQDVILKKASWVLILKGRVNYEGMKGKGSRFPSALIGLNVKHPQNIEGYVLEPMHSLIKGD